MSGSPANLIFNSVRQSFAQPRSVPSSDLTRGSISSAKTVIPNATPAGAGLAAQDDKKPVSPDEFSPEFLAGLLADEPASPKNIPSAAPTTGGPAKETLRKPAEAPAPVAEPAPKPTEDELIDKMFSKQAEKPAETPAAEAPAPSIDAGPVQYVEVEPHMELPPEVESFLTEVENHHEQLPQEVVIAEDQQNEPVVQPLAQPVIMLPITPGEEKTGKRKSAKLSIGWLVEWSQKMMKMFAGKVVYRAG